MNGIITEGIPLGVPIQILTSGLGESESPPSPITGRKGSLLYINIPKTILSGAASEDVSNSYPLPNGTTKINYQFIGTISDADLLGSLDGIHFSVIANVTEAGIGSIFSNITFIAARINTGSSASVVVTAKREKL